MLEYTQRPNLFRKTRTYSLSPRGLEWEEEGAEGEQLDFGDIEAVELKYTPTRYERNLYRLRIRHRGGGQTDLTNGHYLRFASFEDRSPTFVPFVREFHRALAKANPSVCYRRGMSRTGRTWASAACLLGGLILLAVAAYGVSTGHSSLSFASLFLFLAATLVLRSYFAKNRPGIYDPLELPEELLPREGP